MTTNELSSTWCHPLSVGLLWVVFRSSIFFRSIVESILLLLFMLCYLNSNSQNLVPNPSFEYNTNCPTSVAQFTYASPWVTPSAGSPDYFHPCATSTFCDAPANFFGWQNARSGEAYAQFVTYPSAIYIREYVQVKMDTPLTAGQDYNVVFYISLADNSTLASNNIGAYLSVLAPSATTMDTLPYTPQINETSIIVDKVNWTLVNGSFTASGGEQYITIGNFYGNNTTSTAIVPGGFTIYATFYLIDDVCVTPVGGAGCSTALPIELLAFDTENAGEWVRTFWSTASELNNAYFTVFRSKDAENFSAIGTLTGSGNSYTQLDYEFYDEAPFSGLSYYQLQQTDFDGSTSLSDIVSVDRGNTDDMVIWPNPARDYLQIELNGSNSFSLEVINTLGQTVLLFKLGNKDNGVYQIDTSALPNGFYSLRTIGANGVTKQTKFFKE